MSLFSILLPPCIKKYSPLKAGYFSFPSWVLIFVLVGKLSADSLILIHNAEKEGKVTHQNFKKTLVLRFWIDPALGAIRFRCRLPRRKLEETPASRAEKL